jgi:hypothetical protein
MKRLGTITSAALALGLSTAIPIFAMAAQGHESHSSGRVERSAPARVERNTHARVERSAPAHVERRVETSRGGHIERRIEPRRDHVVVEREHIIRDVRVHRDYHHDYGRYHNDYGWRFGVSVAPVYPVYPSYPVYVNPDCDIALSISDVPACVLDTAGRECGGPIQSVRLIRRGGIETYRLIVDSRDGAFELQVDSAGRLISSGRCE